MSGFRSFFLILFVHLMKVGEGRLLDYGHNNERFRYFHYVNIGVKN